MVSMHIFTIGYSKRSAPEFFGALRRAGIRRCVDVRLANTSQLAGFTKRGDLPFFLRELCGAEYIAEPLLVPTRDLVDAYRKGKASWEEYERRFLQLLAERKVEVELDPRLFDVPTVLPASSKPPSIATGGWCSSTSRMRGANSRSRISSTCATMQHHETDQRAGAAPVRERLASPRGGGGNP